MATYAPMQRLRALGREIAADIRTGWKRLAASFGIGLVGALVFVALNLPLPWVLGAMCTTTIAALFGIRIWVPRWLAGPMIAVLGLLFGTTVAPDLFARVLTWLPSVTGTFVLVFATSTAITWYLRRAAKLDKVTAYFSALPGGILPMTLMGGHYGGQTSTIALIQTIRLIVTIVSIPVAFRLFAGYVPAGGIGAAGGGLAAGDAPAMLLAAVGGYAAARLVRLPTPELVGPLVVMAALHMTGIVPSSVPAPLVAAAQLTIGTRLGAGFLGIRLGAMGGLIGHAVAAGIVMVAISVATALAVHEIAPELTFAALVLAFAPGGIAEMSIVAYGLGIEVAFVITHQMIRFLFIVVGAPLGAAVLGLKRKDRRAGDV